MLVRRFTTAPCSMNTARGRSYSDCFPDPSYWKVGHGPVLHRHGPVVSLL
ncbi:hypothetical protein HanIR_Chr02g0066661 [Helianthus annuus]|nr:hypothetical protein HanIR_Chr02g0066661 [Helianthus annuus]